MLALLWLSTILLAMMSLVQASPAVLTSALLERLRQLQAMSPRGTSDVPLDSFPAQCQKGCSPAVTALNSCSSANCLCTESIDASLSGCIQCSLDTHPSTTWVAGAQQAIDTYNNFCQGTVASSIVLSIPVSTATGNSSTLSTFSVAFATTTPATTGSTATQTPTTITSLPALPTSAAKRGAHSNTRFGLIGVMITFLVPLLT